MIPAVNTQARSILTLTESDTSKYLQRATTALLTGLNADHPVNLQILSRDRQEVAERRHGDLPMPTNSAGPVPPELQSAFLKRSAPVLQASSITYHERYVANREDVAVREDV